MNYLETFRALLLVSIGICIAAVVFGGPLFWRSYRELRRRGQMMTPRLIRGLGALFSLLAFEPVALYIRIALRGEWPVWLDRGLLYMIAVVPGLGGLVFIYIVWAIRRGDRI